MDYKITIIHFQSLKMDYVGNLPMILPTLVITLPTFFTIDINRGSIRKFS